MKEIDEVQVLLDAGATFATEEDLSSGTATDRKVLPYQSYTTKADWLRSEIEKFEVTQREHFCTLENGNDYDHGAWDVYDSIITRYKEELKVLESK